MSDTSYTEIEFIRSDRDAVNSAIKAAGLWVSEITGAPWNSVAEEGDFYIGILDEANYGYDEGKEALKKAGIPFLAFNGAGGTYGPCVSAYSGKGEIIEVNADVDGNPCIAWPEGGASDQDILAVEKYWYTVRKTREVFKERCHEGQ
jgi:hypothetical protein